MDKYTSLAKLYDSFSVDAPSDKWGAYISALLEKNSIKQGAKVLDIACGTGKITLELYKLGYAITALDSSEEMLEIAAMRFANAGARIPVIRQDMREIRMHGSVDAVICINDGINYLTEDSDVLEVFKSVNRALEPDGVFLFDISTKHKLQSMHEKSYFEENDEGLYIWQSEYDKKSDILTMDLSLYTHYEDDLYEKSLETHRQKAHSPETLEQMLGQSGFAQTKYYECFTELAPSDECDRIQFLTVKQLS
jgi:ubiquinone/menaquinone biosynthesis C-methylase UbiE